MDPLIGGALVSGAAGLLGSLFARDPSKSNLEAQKELLRMQWQREDQQRPYQSALFAGPQFQQRLGLGMNNNLMNWGAFAPQMTPRMLDMLRTVAPQYSMPQQMQGAVPSYPPGSQPGYPPGQSGMGGGMPVNRAIPASMPMRMPGNMPMPMTQGTFAGVMR